MGKKEHSHMSIAQTARRPRSIRYEDWRGLIQMAMDLDQLVHVVREYLASWRYEQLRLLPPEVAATALPNSEAIVCRAVLASQAELKAREDDPGYRFLREMALTLGAASARLRHLHAVRETL